MVGIDASLCIAILMVSLYHGLYFRAPGFRNHGIANGLCSLTSGRWAGVNLFFALSGFSSVEKAFYGLFGVGVENPGTVNDKDTAP